MTDQRPQTIQFFLPQGGPRGIRKSREGPQEMFRNGRSPNRRRQRQQTFLDFRCQSKEHHDLRHPGAADALAPGNGGLVRNLADVELATPLDGLVERLDDV